MGLLLNGAGIETFSLQINAKLAHTLCVGLLLNGAGIETKQNTLFHFSSPTVWACSLTERALRLCYPRKSSLIWLVRVGLLLNGAGIETSQSSGSLSLFNLCGPAP